MTLSAGTVSLGVSPVTAGLGAKLAAGIMGESGVLGKVGEELGLKLTAGMAIALVATAGLAVKMASDMQESDAKIQGNAQITAKAATAVGDAFLGTAGKSTFSGAEMAKAFAPVAGVIQTITGHTLTAADSMKVMAASSDLAEASGQPLANTTADLAAVMQSFGLKVGDAADTSNTLFNTSRLTNVGLDQLASTVDRLHGRLGIAAPSLADTSGLMVDLASHGISGSRGVMVVQSALTTLLGGSKATNGELKTLGVNVFDSSGKFVGMQSVLAQLTPKLKGMSDSQRTAAESALFGSSSAAALNSTVLAGAKSLGDATAKVTAHDAAEKAAAASASTFEGKLKTLKSGFTDILTTVGEKLMPVFMALETWVTKNIGPILTIVATLVAWKIATLAISEATKAWTIIQGLFNVIMAADPIVLIIIAVTALVVAIILIATKTTFFQTVWLAAMILIGIGWKSTVEIFTNSVGMFVDFFTNTVGMFVDFGGKVAGVWNALWGGVGNFFKSTWDLIVLGVQIYISTVLTVVSAVGSTIAAVWNGIWSGISSVFSGVWGGITRAVQSISGIFSSAFSGVAGIVQGAFGGVVSVIKGVINSVIDVVNTGIGGINAVGGAVGIHVGKIPKLAAGATILPTPGGTIVRVAEGGKAESVVDTGKMNKLLDAATVGSNSRPMKIEGTMDLGNGLVGLVKGVISNQVQASTAAGYGKK